MRPEARSQAELSAATDVATERRSPQGSNLLPCAERGQRGRSTVKEGAVDSGLHPARQQTHNKHPELNTRHVTGSYDTRPSSSSPSHSCIMPTSTTASLAPSLLPTAQRHDNGCDNDNDNDNHNDRNRLLRGSAPVQHRRGLIALDSLNLEQSQLGSPIPNDGRNHDSRKSLPLDRDHNRPAADEFLAMDAEARASVEDCADQESFDTKKKTLSTSSISSTSSVTSASSESTATSASLPSSPSPPSPSHVSSFSKEKSLDLAAPASTALSMDPEPLIDTGVQEDIKEVEIETEDPSHLFWVPFHMHPEIAPNEYNKWLSRHGVDSTGTGAANVLSHRNSAVNRRKSVLSAQYNPEDDDEEEELAERKKSRRLAVGGGIAEQEEERPREDFLSGVFSTPLEQMGEPPLKTRTSLRRSTSQTTSTTSPAHKDAVDFNTEDTTTVRRAGATGLSRNGPSLMRRSARTKIRRDSTASTDVRHDPSRLRRTVDENGDYAAVTLVDPGPLPLLPSSPPSTLTQPAESVAPLKDEDGKAQETEKSPSKPLKRFVSTLRDSSKPTITTYIEPQLLEQQRKDMQEEADGVNGITTNPSLSTGATASSGGPKVSQVYETVPVSKVMFPIPPPVKLSQNLLQQPATRPSSAKQTSKQQQQQHQLNSTQKQSVPLLSAPPHSKKSSSWSWLWGKEKGGAGGGSDADQQRTQLTPGMPLSRQHPPLAPSENGKKTLPSGETTAVIAAVKKQSTLSLLFSRNGKTSQSKAQQQQSSSETHGARSFSGNRNSGPSSGYHVGAATEIRDDEGFVHQVVPQQDSNSHARSPSPGVNSKQTRGSTTALATSNSNSNSSSNNNNSPSKRDAVYDEESMIGGGYNGDDILGWSEEEDLEEEEEEEEHGYQGVTDGFASLHSLPSGPSSTSSPLPVQPLAYSY
ncbi:hypothetical protein KVV02_006098 [Mortierella alpina]|uniref:Uncharacterized protein n=1 Tax=Mortierella alpina TaxID=64518 RepID=A0A9P8CZE1_MORAP|nr:hypothetical protein KVV02_006098 [Mortierella alpina]